MSKESCPTEEASVSGKSGYEPTPRRQWTSLSVHDERRLLHRELAAAAAAGDETEVQRISARLRLLER
jgi:hypothetical protein